MSSTVIAILGGGLAREGSRWRTTNFSEHDKFGALGDRLRVEAAAVLWQNNPEAKIVALGGKGQYQNIPDAPAVAAVIKKELVELGVPANSIATEKKSGNTWQQLQALKNITGDILIISNRYHLPRIQAMVEKDSAIHATAQAAEEILIKHDPANWRALIEKAYESEAMKQRLALEAQGVAEIKSGAYKLE